MTDGLLPFDRCMEIMYMLSAKRRITRRELALEFSVSDNVIDRDLVILNRYLPLEIVRGRYGGVAEQKGGMPPSVLCVICGMSNAAYKREDGVFVVPITALKN